MINRLILAVLLAPLTVSGQTVSTDTYKTYSGYEFRTFDTLRLGQPLSGESYTYILSKAGQLKQGGEAWLVIRGIEKTTNENGIATAKLKLNSASGDDYRALIDKAIASGEVALPPGYDAKAKARPFKEIVVPNRAKTIAWDTVIGLVDETIKQSEVYGRMLSWVGTVYNSAQTVIQVQDKESGVLIVKASTSYIVPGPMSVSYDNYLDYTLKLSAKNGRARIEMGPFTPRGDAAVGLSGAVVSGPPPRYRGIGKNFYEKAWYAAQKAASDEWNTLLLSFVAALNTKEKDW